MQPENLLKDGKNLNEIQVTRRIQRAINAGDIVFGALVAVALFLSIQLSCSAQHTGLSSATPPMG